MIQTQAQTVFPSCAHERQGPRDIGGPQRRQDLVGGLTIEAQRLWAIDRANLILKRVTLTAYYLISSPDQQSPMPCCCDLGVGRPGSLTVLAVWGQFESVNKRTEPWQREKSVRTLEAVLMVTGQKATVCLSPAGKCPGQLWAKGQLWHTGLFKFCFRRDLSHF